MRNRLKPIFCLLLALLFASWSTIILAQSPPICEGTVVVQADDWLSKIAEKVYGEVLAYQAIADATNAQAAVDNTFTIIDDVNLIEPGWKLCLPPAETVEAALNVAPSQGGTAIIAIGADPGHLNPGISTGSHVHTVADSIYNGLVALDRNLTPQPDLARDWQINADSTVYTFTLVSGVQWHDGQPLTAADVKFSFEEVLFNYHARTKAGLGNVVAAIETPDELTVVFRFKEPYGSLLSRLDVTEAPILPKHITRTAIRTTIRPTCSQLAAVLSSLRLTTPATA